MKDEPLAIEVMDNGAARILVTPALGLLRSVGEPAVAVAVRLIDTVAHTGALHVWHDDCPTCHRRGGSGEPIHPQLGASVRASTVIYDVLDRAMADVIDVTPAVVVMYELAMWIRIAHLAGRCLVVAYPIGAAIARPSSVAHLRARHIGLGSRRSARGGCLGEGGS